MAGKRNKAIELEIKSETKKLENEKINSAARERLQHLYISSQRLANAFKGSFIVDLNTHTVTLDAVENIRTIFNEIKNLSGNEPNYDFLIRRAEYNCLTILNNLYQQLGDTINTHKITAPIRALMEEIYIPILQQVLSTANFNNLMNQSGLELLYYTTYLFQMRLAQVSPKLDNALATHEVFTSKDHLHNLRSLHFYDSKTTEDSKNSSPQTFGALFLDGKTSWIKHNISRQQTKTLTMLKEAKYKTELNTTFIFEGKIPVSHVKCLKTQDEKRFNNPYWNSVIQENFASTTNKASIGETEIMHIYIVAPAKEKLDQANKSKHQIFFLSEEKAKEFVEQARKHPYWYDEELGWNLEGWSKLMTTKDQILTSLEATFLKQRTTQSYFLTKKELLPEFETAKQELDGLRAVIEAIQAAPTASSAITVIETTINSLMATRSNERTSQGSKENSWQQALSEAINNISNQEARSRLRSHLQSQVNDFKELVNQPSDELSPR